MPISLPSGSPLWLVVLGGFVSFVAIAVGVIRKWKAGEIADDGVILDRVNRDNVNLREQLATALKDKELLHVLLDDERIKRRHAEDAAAIYYRQLTVAKMTPEKVT